MPWQAISLVSSGATLAAFITAAIAWITNRRLAREERLIATAAEAKRAQLVADALEVFHVDTASLTKQQRYDIAIRQINQRARRFETVAVAVVLLAVIAAIVAVYSLKQSYTGEGGAPPDALQPIVHGHATGLAEADSTGSAVQIFEHGWMVDHFGDRTLFAVGFDDKHPRVVHWLGRVSGFVKDGSTSCHDLMSLGFAWWYCRSRDSGRLQRMLGQPIAKETRAWVEFQTWDGFLLISGVPTTKPGVVTGVFEELGAASLEGAEDPSRHEGQGKMTEFVPVPGAYCSCNWYAAHKDLTLPQELLQLVASGKCQSPVGPSLFTTPAPQVRLL